MSDLDSSFSGSRKSAEFFSYNLNGSPVARRRSEGRLSSMEKRFNRFKARVLRSPDKKKEFPKTADDDEDENAKPSTASATKEKEEKKPEKSKTPSKDQAEKWTSSINSLLVDPEGIEAFRNFLKDMEDEEGEFTRYIDFYMECENYKYEFKKLEENAKKICETYLDVAAEKEVGTGGKSVKIRDKLDAEGLEGVTLFDEPQTKVKQKLSDNYYANFCSHLKVQLRL